MAGRSDGPRGEANGALAALHRRYFWIHLSVQSVCAALFLAGSILTLMEATKPAASWVYLAGGVTFAALPVLRLLNEKARRAGASPENDETR